MNLNGQQETTFAMRITPVNVGKLATGISSSDVRVITDVDQPQPVSLMSSL